MIAYVEMVVSVRVEVPEGADEKAIHHAAVEAVEHGEAEVWQLEYWTRRPAHEAARG